jgi:hypothetical protein
MPAASQSVSSVTSATGRAPNRRVMAAILLSVLLIAGAAPYVRAGVARAYFAADDFQWIAGGHTLGWSRIADVRSRDHFYRPMIDAWFTVSVAGCGGATACYHLASLAVHLLNIAMVFALALLLFGDLRVAFLGALLFALEPAYAQAVVWISAITGVLATACYLASLVFQVRSWTASSPSQRTRDELLAVLAFAGALFSHEAAATLPIVAWVMWRQFGPGDWSGRRLLLAGFALMAVAFAATTALANRGNYVFTAGNYAFGWHAVRHAFDYFVALYVGPGWWFAYAACAAGIAGLLVATPVTRFGVWWLIATLVPYVWFTWGNASRYLYLPSIGFALAIAGLMVAGSDGVVTRLRAPRFVGRVVFALGVGFVAIRFGQFAAAAAEGQVASMEHWRAYAAKLAAEAPSPPDGVIRLRAPEDDLVQPMYLEPMLQWERQNYRLRVVEP